MSRPVPPHGHANRYAYGCRCQPCTRAATRADAQRRLDRLSGRPRTIPAGPVMEHVTALMSDRGLTSWQVAREAGVEPSTVQRLAKGQVRVRATTAEKILRVPLDVRVSLGDVPSVGAVRRVRALYALGHFNRDIASEAGISRDAVYGLAAGKWPTIKVGADDGIRAAYDRLSMTAGDSWKTRRTAERNGWAPPLAWDDDTIDDPAAGPVVDAEDSLLPAGTPGEVAAVDPVAVQRFVSGSPVDLTDEEYVAALQECIARGMSYLQIDALRGQPRKTTMNAVNRLRKRYERVGRVFPIAPRSVVELRETADVQRDFAAAV